MLHYTPLPLELILEGFDEKRNYREIQFEGVTLLIEEVNSKENKIVQILSTNPQDFLNPKLQPGNLLSFEYLHQSQN